MYSVSRLYGLSVKTAVNIALVSIVLYMVLFWHGDQYEAMSFADEARAKIQSMRKTSASSQEVLRIKAQDRADAMDKKYFFRLVSDKKSGPAHLHLSTGSESQKSNRTATVVIGALAGDEDQIQWALNDLEDVNPYIYLVDTNKTSRPHLARNQGREVAVYMTYIIENYDNLTDVNFFWHGDRKVWHNNLLMRWDSVETINRMDRENIMKRGYVPSRCDHWPGCPGWIKFNPSSAEHNLDPHRLGDLFTPDQFRDLFPGETDFPPFFAGTCCSQFAVSRDTIRRHPKEFYQRLLNFVMYEFEDDQQSGRLFEYSWPYIFLGQGALCPSMADCYCSTYNLCLEDQSEISKIERWNALRTRREEVKWQVEFNEKALEEKLQQLEESGADDDTVFKVEQALYPEIERLTDDMEMLANETWFAREDIIARWRLPAPPVGW